MNTFRKYHYPKRSLKPLVLALAFALPASAALAASMDDVVKTRADQNIDQQYGRDSVYAFSPESKPLSPERTSGPRWLHNWFHGTKASDATTSARYEGYVPKQQDAVALNAGSGYTGSESTSQADTGAAAFVQSTSDVGLAAEAQDGWGSEYALVMPLAVELTPEPVALADGTATQFNRGYYKDPDQGEAIIIISDNAIPDNIAMAEDQTGSAEEQGSSTE